MRKTSHVLLTTLALLAGSAVQAAEFATPKEAEALVGKAIASIKADRHKTYEEITAKGARWVDRDLYPVVYGLDGVVLAHGQNAKMVGKDLLELKDADGKPFVKERVELARSKAKFWQDYKFTDPVSKRVLPKQMYCERLDETVVCAGVYKH